MRSLPLPPGLLQARQLGAQRRRAPGHIVAVGQPARAHRAVELLMSLHDLAQDEALAGRDLHADKVRPPLYSEPRGASQALS